MLSGRQEMVLKIRFNEWSTFTRRAVQRRAELARKALGRYTNQMIAKCFLAWSMILAHAKDSRHRQLLMVGSYIADRDDVRLQLAFVALRQATAQSRDDRQILVQNALTQLRYGMHMCTRAYA